MKAKEELALEIERRKKAENKIAKKERQISEVKEQVVLDFKVSNDLENININFANEAFIRGFKLCQRNVVEKFSELDFSFLTVESSDEEAEPSTTSTDLPTTKPTVATSEPACEFEAIEDAPTSSAAPPLEVGDF